METLEEKIKRLMREMPEAPNLEIEDFDEGDLEPVTMEIHQEKEQTEWAFHTILSDLCDPYLIHNEKEALFQRIPEFVSSVEHLLKFSNYHPDVIYLLFRILYEDYPSEFIPLEKKLYLCLYDAITYPDLAADVLYNMANIFDEKDFPYPFYVKIQANKWLKSEYILFEENRDLLVTMSASPKT